MIDCGYRGWGGKESYCVLSVVVLGEGCRNVDYYPKMAKLHNSTSSVLSLSIGQQAVDCPSLYPYLRKNCYLQSPTFSYPLFQVISPNKSSIFHYKDSVSLELHMSDNYHFRSLLSLSNSTTSSTAVIHYCSSYMCLFLNKCAPCVLLPHFLKCMRGWNCGIPFLFQHSGEQKKFNSPPP